MGYILGLDLGANSVGWSVVDIQGKSIVRSGVRIFSEGVQNLGQSGEESKAVQRRIKRALRKSYERRRNRKNKLRKQLIDIGMLPTDPVEFDSLFKSDPYQLRSRALTERLSLYEIGRIIDHINARRGFKSNRKFVGDEEESGAIYEGTGDEALGDWKPGIHDVSNALSVETASWKSYMQFAETAAPSDFAKLKGFPTLGAYLQSLNPHERRRRNRFLLREHLMIELDLILRVQKQYYPQLTQEVANTLATIVFWQRPLKSSRHLVGLCRFEPGKKRCHRSHPEFQEFRLLQQINNLEIYGPGRVTDDERRLTPSERESLLTYMRREGKAINLTKSRSAIYKVLGLSTKSQYTFNLERLDALTTRHKIESIVGPDLYASWSPNDLHEIWNVLNFAEDPAWLYDYAIRVWNLNDEQANKISSIHLEEGYSSLSLKAVRKILPHLMQDFPYYEAAGRAGYSFSESLEHITLTDKVPALSAADARNPIVQVSFAQMRKVVNALLATYGRFDSIRVELAREIRQPKSERVEADKRNKRNRDDNEVLREKIEKEYGVIARRADLERYRLWESQNHKCIYTGTPISGAELFSGTVDVDHILPYSRTLDDRAVNKAVCLRSANAEKGNRTPLEAINAGVFNGDELRERIEHLVRALKISKDKAARFFMDEEQMSKLYGGDFVERKLQDTRFIGTLTRRYLRHVCEDVVVSSGTLTSMLRKRWGLDGVIDELAREGRAWVSQDAESGGKKDRADHRHHAVDAITIALTDRSIIRAISTLNASEHSLDPRIKLPEAPIPGLRHLAKESIDRIIVSHKVNRRLRGALHEETFYGRAHDHRGVPLTDDKGQPLYVVRKPLTSLSVSQIDQIVSPQIKRLVLDRLTNLGVDVSKKYVVPKNAFLTPIHIVGKDGKPKHVVRRVRVFVAANKMVRLRSYGLYVEPGSNDHYEIGMANEGGKRNGAVVSLFDAVRSQTRNFATDFKLRANEMYVFQDSDEPLHPNNIYRVQKITEGNITFRSHAAASIEDNASRLNKAPSTLNGYKAKVDILGNLKPC